MLKLSEKNTDGSPPRFAHYLIHRALERFDVIRIGSGATDRRALRYCALGRSVQVGGGAQRPRAKRLGRHPGATAGVGGLILHFVIFSRTPIIKAVDYKVVVAEFFATGDVSSLESARSQLVIQSNGYGRNGWTLLQALTGQHPGGKSFIALLLKKPIY